MWPGGGGIPAVTSGLNPYPFWFAVLVVHLHGGAAGGEQLLVPGSSVVACASIRWRSSSARSGARIRCLESSWRTRSSLRPRCCRSQNCSTWSRQ